FCFFCIKVYGILSKIAFSMLNQAPQRRKASAKVEQNIIAAKHTTNFFYAKSKIVPEEQSLTCRDGRIQGKQPKNWGEKS
ncbi:hypothetical protein, partial [Alloprevotella tannerae]|uniref:hypothetical protein n=1 Tax=Alloprevotella tannerae TaxID=76122 RepID=UPI0028E26143